MMLEDEIVFYCCYNGYYCHGDGELGMLGAGLKVLTYTGKALPGSCARAPAESSRGRAAGSRVARTTSHELPSLPGCDGASAYTAGVQCSMPEVWCCRWNRSPSGTDAPAVNGSDFL